MDTARAGVSGGGRVHARSGAMAESGRGGQTPPGRNHRSPATRWSRTGRQCGMARQGGEGRGPHGPTLDAQGRMGGVQSACALHAGGVARVVMARALFCHQNRAGAGLARVADPVRRPAQCDPGAQHGADAAPVAGGLRVLPAERCAFAYGGPAAREPAECAAGCAGFDDRLCGSRPGPGCGHEPGRQ
ncbi:hypothetical protein FQZ97_884720 [compost metagenome]